MKKIGVMISDESNNYINKVKNLYRLSQKDEAMEKIIIDHEKLSLIKNIEVIEILKIPRPKSISI